MADYKHYDAALDQLKDCGPDLQNGFTSHMPMVVEALCRMGEGDKAEGWLNSHVGEAVPLTEYKEQAPIDDQWPDALGMENRFADWRRMFDEDIATYGWQAVLEMWVPRLAPGFMAAATHGLLRTAHVARTLPDQETSERLGELAQGLALWASTYQTLPLVLEGPTQSFSKPLPLTEALAVIPMLSESERENGGAITHALSQLAGHDAFGPVIHLLVFADDARETALDLAEALVGVYLRHAKDPLSSVVFTHGVTSVAATHGLMGLVSKEAGETLLRFAWQGVAGLYATYGDLDAKAEGRAAESEAEIVVQAVAHGDDHIIKLAEACLGLHKLRPNTQFLTAPGLARACVPG